MHPSPRLLELVAHTGDLKVRMEPSRAQLSDDILRGRVVAGLVTSAGAGRVRCASTS